MKNDIKIGDVLYEPSITYGRVITHEILSIYFEAHVSDWKTIVVTDSSLGMQHILSNDVLRWCFTKEEAEKELAKKMHKVK